MNMRIEMKQNLIGKKILGVLHGKTLMRYVEGEEPKYSSISDLKESLGVKVRRLPETEWAVKDSGRNMIFRKAKKIEWHIYEIIG